MWPGPQCVPLQFTIICDLSPKGHLRLVLPDIFVLFSAAGQPPPLPPVDGCDIVTVGSHAPFFFFSNCTFILYLFLTSLVVKHWWWQANVCSESYFSFPPPHIITLSPVSIFIFQMYCPLFFTSPIPPPHPHCPLHSCLFPPPFSPNVCLIPHLPYFSVASSQANNQLINQLSPRIIVAALRGAL